MIKIQGKIPRQINIACSGGVDSMAVVDFLSKSHKLNLMFFDHGTETSKEAKEFLLEYVAKSDRGITLEIGHILEEKHPRESWEEYWRNERYRWFFSKEEQIVTCHHLDDCVETWIWSSLNGEGKIIPYSNRNIIRPFMLNRKTEFYEWAKDKMVPWVEDKSNDDPKYARNYIRNVMLPNALVINPGIHKVIAKKVKRNA